MAHLSARAGIAIEWVCALIATVLFGLRIYVRWWKLYHLSISDLLIFFGWVIFIYVTVSNTTNWVLGAWDNPNISFTGIHIVDAERELPPPNHLRITFKLFYVAGSVYYVSLFCIKFAFLVMYYKLVPKTGYRVLRWALHTTTAITAFAFFLMNGMNWFICRPIRRNWSLDPKEACFSFSDARSYWVSLSLHIFTDILIFTLPFPLLSKLQLTARAKYGVYAMFALGALCILCTVGRAVSIGSSLALPPVGVWCGVEMAIAISVICAPTLKWMVSSMRSSHDTGITKDGKSPPRSELQKEWGTVTRKKRQSRLGRNASTRSYVGDVREIWKKTDIDLEIQISITAAATTSDDSLTYKQRVEDEDLEWDGRSAGKPSLPEKARCSNSRTWSIYARSP